MGVAVQISKATPEETLPFDAALQGSTVEVISTALWPDTVSLLLQTDLPWGAIFIKNTAPRITEPLLADLSMFTVKII